EVCGQQLLYGGRIGRKNGGDEVEARLDRNREEGRERAPRRKEFFLLRAPQRRNLPAEGAAVRREGGVSRHRPHAERSVRGILPRLCPVCSRQCQSGN